ncbi:MAG: peptidyl-prolyl cis-trans isomerase [Rhodanobacteraceae bacterium]|nr:peptidyl-prolyl cis-trans isomerase [Rhodanobacteraceae bacterium]
MNSCAAYHSHSRLKEFPVLKHFLLAFALTLPLAATAQNQPKPTDKTDAKPAAAKIAEAPAEGTKAANPQVVLHTSMGDITIELYPDKAPKSVENFQQYVKDGFYNGTVFHRVINGFMIQGGGFTKDLTQKRTRPAIQNEANNGLSNLKGTVAMARTGDPHSATAQFFINVVDNKRLDYVSDQSGMTYGYAVFGKVVAGMDVVEKIKTVETSPQGPLPSDVPKVAITIDKAELAQ